jgi:diguanylate cyclase (GGDEF)-like protein
MPAPEKSIHSPLVLIANDQEWSARSLESILVPKGYEVVRAYTGRQALERARSAHPDIIILDAQMPDLHGVEVCRQLRADPRFSPTVPIIITTAGPSGRAQRLEAYQAGAWEFLGQPLDGESLLLKLESFLRAKLEVDRVHDESLLDQVTGLYNMRGLSRRAREIGSEAFRRRHALACIVFAPESPDFGDTRTEEVATRLAAAVGEALRKSGRSSDAIGRLGPLEFAVIAPATGPAAAVKLVERLRETVETQPIPSNGNPRPAIDLRAGYYAVPDFHDAHVDATEMLLRATTALRSLQSDQLGSLRAFQAN